MTRPICIVLLLAAPVLSQQALPTLPIPIVPPPIPTSPPAPPPAVPEIRVQAPVNIVDPCI